MVGVQLRSHVIYVLKTQPTPSKPIDYDYNNMRSGIDTCAST
jgi:hypothetical protein